MFNRSQPGFGLVETLIASVIVATLVLTFYGISSAVTNNVALANERATAANLAVEGLELARSWRDAGSKNSRVVTGPNVTDVENWDEIIQTNKSLPAQVGPTNILLDGITYTRKIEFFQDAAHTLPRLAYQDNANNWQTLAVTDYQVDYWQVMVTVTWPGRVSGNSYVISSYLTNWNQTRP
ncbi:MAG: hypothetical protein Q7S64_01075 [bacterium]|nr:hypothetical protein [bacterium]